MFKKSVSSWSHDATFYDEENMQLGKLYACGDIDTRRIEVLGGAYVA